MTLFDETYAAPCVNLHVVAQSHLHVLKKKRQLTFQDPAYDKLVFKGQKHYMNHSANEHKGGPSEYFDRLTLRCINAIIPTADCTALEKKAQ